MMITFDKKKVMYESEIFIHYTKQKTNKTTEKPDAINGPYIILIARQCL
jgi:hypothetical protein